MGNPQVSYRETVTTPVTHTEVFDRTLAGKENHAVITLEVKPGERS